MEKNFLDKIYGNMNYNTFNTVQNVWRVSSIGLVVARNFILNNYQVAPDVANALTWLFFTYYFGNNIIASQTHTKDVREVKDMYNKIIKDYNKLHKIFDFENPLEIHTMYNYLLYKGYLSKDKSFQFSANKVRDIKTLFGANVVNGQGVCRHIAIMLRDIYRDYGIDSNAISVTMRKAVVTIYTGENRINQTAEEMQEFIKRYVIDEKERKIFKEIINKYADKISFSYRLEDDKNKVAQVTGNHLITMAIKDEKSYIVDPTQARVYKLNPKDNGFLTDNEDDKIKLSLGSLGLFEKLRDIKIIKSRLSLPTIPLNEEQLLRERTKKICEENQDLFEQFYNEHNEIYNDLSDKLMIMKKPKSILRRPKLN